MNKSRPDPANRRALLGLAMLALMNVQPATAQSSGAASNYPNRAIKLVVPYNPGGVADSLGRSLAEGIKKELGQPVIVDNRAGANTAVGAAAVAKSPADGYTILLVTPATLILNPLLMPQLSYKPEELTEIYNVATTPIALSVKTDGPVNDFNGLLNAIRKANGAAAFSSTGIGSSTHLAGELLQMETKTQMIHAPYNGSGPALTAVMAGEVLLSSDSMASAIAMYPGQRIKPIAVTSKKRAQALPNVPTLYELGLKSFDVSTWYGIVAPAKTPADVLAKLHGAIAKTVANDDFIKRFSAQGLEIQPTHTPADFKAFVQRERSLWQPVIKEKNIQVGN